MAETFNLDEEVIIGLKNNNNTKANKNKKLNNVEIKNNNIPSKNRKNQSSKGKNNNKKSRKKQKVDNKKIQKNKKVKKQKKELTPEQLRKRKRIYRILKILSIILILIVIILLTMFSPLFNIKEIQVTGNSQISTDSIISLSQIQVGQNTYKIDDGKVQKRIKENAYIDEVKIVRHLPTTIEIQVQERVATFMLEYGNGYVYLNNQGYMLEISEEKIEVPIIQGAQVSDEQIKVGNRLPKEDLLKMEVVLKIVEAAKQVEIMNLLTKIDISDETDYKAMFDTEQKVTHLGDASNITNKLEFVKEIMEDKKGTPGEIFVNMNLNEKNPYFRSQV